MLTLHLHAGLPKTGSSALQRFLVENRGRLAGHGLHLVRRGQRADGPHHALLARLCGLTGPGRRAEAAALLAELRASGAGQALISSELTLPLLRTGLLGPALGRLRREGIRFRVHLFIRPQAEYWNSAYPELLRSTLSSAGFARFLDDRLRAPGRDYAALVAPLARLGPVTLHPYSAAARRAGIWWPFLKGLGIDETPRPGWILPGEIRPTPGPTATRALELLAADLVRRRAIRGIRHRLGIRAALAGAFETLPAEPESFIGLDTAMATRIRTRTAAANAAFARTHWGRDWDDVFAEEAGRSWRPNASLHRPDDAAGAEALARRLLPACLAVPPPTAHPVRAAAERLADRVFLRALRRG